MSQSLARTMSALSFLVPMALGACGSDGDGSSTTTQTATALESAQCTLRKGRDTELACFNTYVICAAASGADLALCRAALQDCLPKPPPLPTTTSSSDRGGGEGRGGGDRGHGGGDQGGKRGDSAPHPTPDPAAVATCRTALDSCLASLKGDQSPCFVAETKCVDETFRAAFQAQCDASTARCANVDTDDTDAVAACDAVKKRCTEGVGARFAKGSTPCP